MVIVTIRPWKNFNTSKQLIAIERKVVGLFGCCLLESCIVCYLTACLIVKPWPQTLSPKTKKPKRGLGLTLKSHYQNASIQGIQIQCRKDQMQVYHVDKDIV